jgi:integrase
MSSDPSALVKPPRAQESPTLPFEAGEIEALLKAADTFNAGGRFGAGNRTRIRAMVLLLRYSGLRISDAAVLERARLSDDKLFLYTQKTGTPVWVPLPPATVGAAQFVVGRQGRPRSAAGGIQNSARQASWPLGSCTKSRRRLNRS